MVVLVVVAFRNPPAHAPPGFEPSGSADSTQQGACCIFGRFITRHRMFTAPPPVAALFAAPTDRPWATGIKETLARRTHGTTVSASGTCLRRSSFARNIGRGRKFSAKSPSGHRRQRARPRSLCASYRTLQTTQPSSPAHPATHTSSSARLSLDTLSLMLPGVESLGSTCALNGMQSTAEFLLPEHRNHRSVSPTDGSQLGACRFKPCAQR